MKTDSKRFYCSSGDGSYIEVGKLFNGLIDINIHKNRGGIQLDKKDSKQFRKHIKGLEL